MGVLIFQELAPFLAFSGWLSRRQRACPSVFLDKQFFKEQRKYKKTLYLSTNFLLQLKLLASKSGSWLTGGKKYGG